LDHRNLPAVAKEGKPILSHIQCTLSNITPVLSKTVTPGKAENPSTRRKGGNQIGWSGDRVIWKRAEISPMARWSDGPIAGFPLTPFLRVEGFSAEWGVNSFLNNKEETRKQRK